MEAIFENLPVEVVGHELPEERPMVAPRGERSPTLSKRNLLLEMLHRQLKEELGVSVIHEIPYDEDQSSIVSSIHSLRLDEENFEH